MNATIRNISRCKTVMATTVAFVLLTACATAHVQRAGADRVRNKLTELQTDPNLGSRAPLAIKEAQVAVSIAEQPQADVRLAQHRIYMADRKVETARAQAETRFAEDQRGALSKQLRSAADQARGAANGVLVITLSPDQQAAGLQREIDELQARRTERGSVMARGDVLFTSGHADLNPDAAGNLDKLVTFLNEYPNCTVTIEGYTDNVGSQDDNRRLSQRRADSVKRYLIGRGVRSARLATSGKGESAPIAGNGSADGQQRNRRVELIIENPPAAVSR